MRLVDLLEDRKALGSKRRRRTGGGQKKDQDRGGKADPGEAHAGAP
jgi:hypothetical protein